MIEEKLQECFDKSYAWGETIPPEVYWDFAGSDRTLLKDTLVSAYMSGYICGYKKAKLELESNS